MLRKALLLLWLLLLVPAAAHARPGGGHSYGGGSHSSGGGSHSSGGSYHSSGSSSYHYSSGGSSSYSGSNSNGDPIFMLIVILIVIGWVIVQQVGNAGMGGAKEWNTSSTATSGGSEAPAQLFVPEISRRALERLRKTDPDFSVVLFEDFLYALYARAHAGRGVNARQGPSSIDHLAPWISASARAIFSRTRALEVNTVIVGAMHYRLCRINEDGAATINVEFEANYTEVSQENRPQTFWVDEVWSLSRRAGAKSRAPESIRRFSCPGCGAPLESIRGNTCTRCERVLDTGEWDWVVTNVQVRERRMRGPQLTGTTEEEGTSLATRFDTDRARQESALTAKDPAFSEAGFFARVTAIFDELQIAWSTRRWERARAFVSDQLFQTQLFWIDAYVKQGLRNLTENARITRLEIVRVTSDRFYDAITVRIHATSLDYTIDDHTQRVVGGSRTRERAYTEYWTLIRGAATKGAARHDRNCPSCGAELKVNMAGVCEYCGTKLVTGDFDWVLSRIEQDEAYTG